MADITTRETSGGGATVKGSPLTNAEVDTNFINLQTDKIELTDISVAAEPDPSGDGSLAYNSTTGVFTYTPPADIGGAVTFAAQAGEALSKGDVVYVSGVSGNTPVVSKADADDANKMPAYGLAEDAANLNAAVNVVTFGTLYNLNTSGFSAGDNVYVSTTAGALTNSAPTGESSLIQNIGMVVRSHASAGSIKVGGAGRTNATPNLNDGNVFIGNASNQAVARALTGDDISGGTITSFASTGIDDNATSTAITIDSSENVGIGTTSPSRLLTLSDSGDAIFSLVSTTDNTCQVLFGDSVSDSVGRVSYDNSDNSMALFTSQTERMRIDSSGNVGIGTSSPSILLGTGLHIDSSGYTSIVLQKGGAGQGHNIDFTDASNALQYRIGTNFASGGENLLFAYGSTPTIGMTLNSSGNVGIRTASPSYALDVVGAIRATNSSGSTIIVNRTSNPGSIELQHSGTQTANFQAISGGGVATYIGSSPSEAMRITSAGNVGIGTTSPAVKTQIVGSGAIFRISDDVSTSGTIELSASSSEAVIHANTYASAVPLVFKNAGTERMRIDSSGNLLVGTTSPVGGSSVAGVTITEVSNIGQISIGKTYSGSTAAVKFYFGTTQVGRIDYSDTATTYVTTSDQRLKENIVDAPAGNIDAIRVRSFDWKADGTHQPYGMIAQELVEVAPEAVSQGETEEDHWGVDYSKLVPMMIKEIQDLKAEVAALKGE